MKILTKLHLIELLKTKQAVAFLRDGETIEIFETQALVWFDRISTGEIDRYVVETAYCVWIAANPEEYNENALWLVVGTGRCPHCLKPDCECSTNDVQPEGGAQ